MFTTNCQLSKITKYTIDSLQYVVKVCDLYSTERPQKRGLSTYLYYDAHYIVRSTCLPDRGEETLLFFQIMSKGQGYMLFPTLIQKNMETSKTHKVKTKSDKSKTKQNKNHQNQKSKKATKNFPRWTSTSMCYTCLDLFFKCRVGRVQLQGQVEHHTIFTNTAWKITWTEIWNLEIAKLRFQIQWVYDVLPSPSNQHS